MGFFDFLNQKAGNEGPAPAQPEAAPSTQIIQALLRLPRAERNEAWSRQFLAHVGEASFFTRDPEVVIADRLPYFALHTAPGPRAYPSHVLHHLKDDLLLDQGLGAVINPAGQDADWAFSYGDILQYHLHGAFYPSRDSGACELGPQARLPQAARKVIRAFLQSLGAQAPGVKFAARDQAGPGSLELVFSFAPQDFNSLDDFHFAMSSLAWFLPRNYSYTMAGGLAGQDDGFEAL